MYLSRLTLNPRSNAVQGDLTDCYQFHRTVMKAFNTQRQSSKVLFKRLADYTVLVQSSVQPNWDKITPNYCNDIKTKEITSFLQSIAIGQRFKFQITVNPIVARCVKQRNKYIPLRTEQEQLDWFLARGNKCGFKIIQFSDIKSQKIVSGRKNQQQITLNAVEITGLLQVIDTVKFIDTVSSGIGKGRSFGMGLLTIVPVR